MTWNLVVGDLRVGQVFADALDIGSRHVDADLAYLLGRAAVPVQVLGQFSHNLRTAPLADEDHPALIGIRSKSHILVASGA